MIDSGRRVLSASIVAGGGADESEAAAIAAAVERFAVDTAPPPPSDAGARMTGWQKAALLEGVSARESVYPIDDPIR